MEGRGNKFPKIPPLLYLYPSGKTEGLEGGSGS